jgi:hypothetical protein
MTSSSEPSSNLPTMIAGQDEIVVNPERVEIKNRA